MNITTPYLIFFSSVWFSVEINTFILKTEKILTLKHERALYFKQKYYFQVWPLRPKHYKTNALHKSTHFRCICISHKYSANDDNVRVFSSIALNHQLFHISNIFMTKFIFKRRSAPPLKHGFTVTAVLVL